MLTELKILFDIVGIIAGIASVILLSIALTTGPPLIKKALGQFMLGLILIGLAFLSNIIVEARIIELNLPIGFHRIFMTFAALIFVNSARLFYKIGR